MCDKSILFYYKTHLFCQAKTSQCLQKVFYEIFHRNSYMYEYNSFMNIPWFFIHCADIRRIIALSTTAGSADIFRPICSASGAQRQLHLSNLGLRRTVEGPAPNPDWMLSKKSRADTLYAEIKRAEFGISFSQSQPSTSLL